MTIAHPASMPTLLAWPPVFNVPLVRSKLPLARHHVTLARLALHPMRSACPSAQHVTLDALQLSQDQCHVTHAQPELYNRQTDNHHVLTAPSDNTLRLQLKLYVHHVNLVVSTILLLNCHVLLALLVLNNL